MAATATQTTAPASVRPAADPRRGRLVALLAGMLAAGIVVALAALAATGGLGGPAELGDPGVLVRVGLPVVRVIHDLAAALTIGLLVVAAWMVAPARSVPPAQDDQAAPVLAGAQQDLVRAASTAIGAWLFSGAAVIVFTAADVIGLPVSSPGFGSVLLSFVSSVDLGRQLWASLLLVLVAGCLTITATRVGAATWAAVLSGAALLPLALTGHAAGGADHQNSANGLALHLLGICLWVGGLTAVVWLSRLRSAADQLPRVVQRYSTLAGVTFALVAGSGVVLAILRLRSFDELTSAYGLLVIGKTVALVLLGLAGWRHRNSTIRHLQGRGDRAAFVRLAVVEVLVMAATVGLGVALSRSAPPTSELDESAVVQLLGHLAPPALTAGRFVTAFYPDVLALTALVAAVVWYARAVLALRRRGESWPAVRSAAWAGGWLSYAFLTNGGPSVYADLSLRVHVLQHLGLLVVVPVLWVAASPITLALRTSPARADGSQGTRETLLRLVRSRPSLLLTDPVTSAGLVAAVAILSYFYTGLVQVALFTHVGHLAMSGLFLASGCLFAWVLGGLTPRAGLPAAGRSLRVVTLGVTTVSLLLFGLALSLSSSVLAPQWWAALGRTDTAALIADQRGAAVVAWGAAVVLLAGGLALIRYGAQAAAAAVAGPSPVDAGSAAVVAGAAAPVEPRRGPSDASQRSEPQQDAEVPGDAGPAR